MSMARDPLFRVGDPAHNLIPAHGGAVWYPLHEALLTAGVAGLPALTELGTPSGSKWGTSGAYTFPTANTDCALLAADDATNLYLSSQLSLYPGAVDVHIIIALDLSFSVAPSGSSTLWSFGKYSTASLIGIDMTASEVPRFVARGKGASSGTAVQQNLTAQSGTLTSFRNQGLFSMVVGIRLVDVTSTTAHADVELRAGNGTLSAYYTASNVDVRGDGSDVPGISGGILMSDFGGLYLGARGATSPTNFWGSGASQVGKLGNFSARRFETYNAARVTDALAFMVNRQRDFPRNFCSDA